MSVLEDSIMTAIKDTAEINSETTSPYGVIRKYLTKDGISITQNPSSFIMDSVMLSKDDYVVEVQYCNDGSAVVNLIQRRGWKDLKGDCFFQNGDSAYAAGLKMLRDNLHS